MSQNRFDGDLIVTGNISGRTMSIPASAIGDAETKAAAGIAASKMQQQHQALYNQAHATSAFAEQRVVHVVRGSVAALLTLLEMQVGCSVAATGDSTATIDLLKNGTTILTATAVLNSGVAAYALVSPAGYTSTQLAENDVLSVKVTISAGTGTLPKGVFAVVNLRESPD